MSTNHTENTASQELLSRIEAGKAAVLAQTDLMLREFGRAQSNWKSDGTRVTPVDIAISQNIERLIHERFADDEFFSEELADPARFESEPLRARFAWILDPIDGTNNYATGLASCAISLGLYENGLPVYGIVYDMSRRALIHGGPGLGVFDGDRAVSVSQAAPTPQSLVGFHSPHDKIYAAQAKTIVENFKIRGLGSSTLLLSYVANGMLEGVVDHNVKIWDIAAAIPLCMAGGGELYFFNNTNPLPVRTFDLKMKRIQYIAGGAAFVARARELLGV
ncbi:myo-inositol-1(or 4)-monophosphatase [Ereboglobus sp. PH5-10]|uniref:inositol monophosphatase family protein n=1 Tax=Ereboglobus sp. PH5-10 TaxID=2940629 RepID=UPI0024072F5E|nr:inositol monophosphatase [Ereboglobus sp. PH5-10]MDF9827704.1 myo-inositol-1(or 4)-monophosphatase [Ereboglobus sp. PH5-10]